MNPWLSIWTQPRATIAKMLSRTSPITFWILATISGLHLAMSPTLWILATPLIGYVALSVSAFFIQFTGKWLGGKGSFQQIRLAAAWSSVPYIIPIVMGPLMFLFLGQGFYYPETLSNAQAGLVFLYSLGAMIAAIWALVIYINALSVVQKFSVLRTIGNILLGSVALVAAGAALTMIINFVARFI